MNNKANKSHPAHKIIRQCIIFLLFVMPSTLHSHKAHSSVCVPPGSCALLFGVNGIADRTEEDLDDALDEDFRQLQEFLIDVFWEQTLLPILAQSANEFTTVAMQQAMAIGTFIDAENQIRAQRLLQEIHAQTHKRYQPSVGVCEIGSMTRSLAATEIRNEAISVVLSKRALDRQLGFVDTVASDGRSLEKENRILQFRNLFCNEKDRQAAFETETLRNGLQAVCEQVSWEVGFTAEERERLNSDIDFFSTVESPWTMNVNFRNNVIADDAVAPPIRNEDEEDVLALSANLFGHDLFTRMPATMLTNRPETSINLPQRIYMDMRAVIAKRSVAQNSLFAITAMKSSAGSREETGGDTIGILPASARPYMEHILTDLGIPEDEALRLLGENPSYYAQMEILTKKLYQSPDFYTNLYDKPANVERKTVALQAIKLMQKFDMLKSHLRDEASISVLLELAVVNLQSEIETEILAIGPGSQ